MSRFVGLLGIAAILGAAWLFSTHRRAIRLRTVLWGLGLQIAFAFLVLRFGLGQAALNRAGALVMRLLSYSTAGAEFVFGDLGRPQGRLGLVLAFQVLPAIVFISALFSVLYHYGVMQVIIRVLARMMTATMGVSGAEALDVAASIFMGQTEAPLTIRPFLPETTHSELMTIMTSGMAHVSGAIMGAYILYGIEARLLLASVVMTAPGTILLSKMLVPEIGEPVTAGRVRMPDELEPRDENLLGAIARGTIDGGQLAFNVAIMLISFLALVALANGILGGMHDWFAARHVPFPSSLNAILGALFAPVAFLIGIPWRECPVVGNLLGTRMVVNELVAFSGLATQRALLDPRSVTIATFALCGFANIASIGIQIGGIGALAPNKRRQLAQLGVRAMLAGTMANLLSAAIVGVLL